MKEKKTELADVKKRIKQWKKKLTAMINRFL